MTPKEYKESIAKLFADYIEKGMIIPASVETCYDPVEKRISSVIRYFGHSVIKEASIILLVNFSSQILAVSNRRFGGYSLPGGKREEGENTRETAMRELKEETGLHVSHCDLSYVASGHNVIEGEAMTVFVYFARFVYGKLQNPEPGTEFAWMTFRELLDCSPFKSYYERHFPDGIEHLRPTVFSP